MNRNLLVTVMIAGVLLLNGCALIETTDSVLDCADPWHFDGCILHDK